MNRQSALVLSIILLILFVALAYFGARITFWSSLVFGITISLILLNIYYPPSNLSTDPADFTLILYAAFMLLGLLIIFIYLVIAILSDVRKTNCLPYDFEN